MNKFRLSNNTQIVEYFSTISAHEQFTVRCACNFDNLFYNWIIYRDF